MPAYYFRTYLIYISAEFRLFAITRPLLLKKMHKECVKMNHSQRERKRELKKGKIKRGSADRKSELMREERERKKGWVSKKIDWSEREKDI